MPLSSVVGAQSIIKPGVCTSSTRPASPYDGQVIYMTDVDQTAVWDGTSWVGLDPSRDRNVVINGAMQIAQRGTSTASIASGAPILATADRWGMVFTTASEGTWTNSLENDAPSGSGLRKSYKVLCTTAKASLGAGDALSIRHAIEGQNVQQFLKGTASAKPFTLSFWVKSNVTGTFTVRIADTDNSRHVASAYIISASATWEKKTITFPADTTGMFDNDNAGSLVLVFRLLAGTDFTSGTLQTTWAATSNSTTSAGQTNLASAINNYLQITGVQLEAGAVATPFEFEDISQTLEKCLRYYQKSWADAVVPLASGDANGLVYASSHTAASQGHSIGQITFQVPFRSAPTVTIYGYNPSTAGLVSNVQGTNLAAGSGNTQFITTKSANVWNNSGGTITPNLGGYLFHYVASAEL